MDSTETPKQTSDRDSNEKSPPNARAVFLGWQMVPSGERVALYNVDAPSHPLHMSTVTDATLREHNVPVPETPPPTNGEGSSDEFSSDQRIR